MSKVNKILGLMQEEGIHSITEHDYSAIKQGDRWSEREIKEMKMKKRWRDAGSVSSHELRRVDYERRTESEIEWLEDRVEEIIRWGKR